MTRRRKSQTPKNENSSSTAALYQQKVDNGDVFAMSFLQDYTGRVVVKIMNRSKAVDLNKEAAEIGHLEGLVDLGEFY